MGVLPERVERAAEEGTSQHRWEARLCGDSDVDGDDRRFVI